ncbi:UNVERIFIED_CONTAM: hypothetical protein Sindi_2568200 [Sesamum indicum]
MTEQQMWLAAVGGKNKGRVFGLGFEAHISSRTFTSSQPPSNPVMEDRTGRLETMMADLMDMMLEMRASLLTVARPLTNPSIENQDEDEERLD